MKPPEVLIVIRDIQIRTQKNVLNVSILIQKSDFDSFLTFVQQQRCIVLMKGFLRGK